MLARWREHDVFHETLRRREGAPLYVFYEGPPTANGAPGAHHVLSRVFKDIFPRYKTMCGLPGAPQGGLGLPRPAGRARGRAPARHHAPSTRSRSTGSRSSTSAAASRCSPTSRSGTGSRSGSAFWIDLDDAYVTLANEYIESVWWALKRIWENDLLYEGHKVVPYCPRCGTALSSHEVALGYHDVVDPSIYVRFPVREPRGPARRPGDALLIWTTTPWTLVSNAAVAIDPELDVRARAARRRGAGGRRRARRAGARRGGGGARPVPRQRDRRHRATSRRSRSSRRRSTARAATPCWRPTSSAPTTAPAWCTPRSRSARTTSASASSTA